MVSAGRRGESVEDLRQLELLQNTRMQNTKDTDGVVLAAEVELDSRGVACEERRVYNSVSTISLAIMMNHLPSTSSIQ